MITILLEKILAALTNLLTGFTSDLATIKAKLEGISDLIIRNVITTDTDTIEFNTDLTEKLCKCKISFEIIQAGSGTPSPDNVRTISGYDSISVAVLDAHDPDVYTTKEIEFDNTVYIGEVDIIRGSGFERYGKITFDGSQPNNQFSFASFENQNRIAWNPFQTLGEIGSKNFYSNKLATSSDYSSVPSDWTIANSSSTVARCFIGVPLSITSVADWQAYVTSNPIELYYPLATPTPISTTPEDITTIEGDNVITTNSQITSEDINTTGIEVCYFETVNNYFKNKEV